MEAMAIALAIVVVVSGGCWLAAAAAARRRRRIDAVMSILRQRFAQGMVTPYQAACFTAVPAIEVAVWLLLERGDVLVSRDGRVRKAHVDGTAAAADRDEDGRDRHDRIQTSVLATLASAPDGLKLHEIAADPDCRQASVQAQDLGIPDLNVLDGTGVTIVRAMRWLAEQSRQVLAARFAALGHDDERRAVSLYRTRAPIYFPPGTPRHVVNATARRHQSGSGTDTSFLLIANGTTGGGSTSGCASSGGCAGTSGCGGASGCGGGGGGGGGGGCGGGSS
ncbi:hypothetical protein LO772_33125 [Yinghuangia sp. ASG 101]|uniref:hypothetical protein n=1 Tax=Yinghuangia sp. ASG 101 TaxID=2896848 RepID=UPI001E51D729|nr:hypothetical protein [Yinghuangia sp. ASG 101]UGQ11566.1 hypothetical protein LO772_33125 [Yinghuangia sp. ASG 101]